MKIPKFTEIDIDTLFLNRVTAAEILRFISDVPSESDTPVVRRAENGEYVILKLKHHPHGTVLSIGKFTPPPQPIDISPSWSLIIRNILAALADARHRIFGR